MCNCKVCFFRLWSKIWIELIASVVIDWNIYWNMTMVIERDATNYTFPTIMGDVEEGVCASLYTQFQFVFISVRKLLSWGMKVNYSQNTKLNDFGFYYIVYCTSSSSFFQNMNDNWDGVYRSTQTRVHCPMLQGVTDMKHLLCKDGKWWLNLLSGL